MSKRFAVIGAGAGGLCAAKHLIDAGVDVTVFEMGSHIGGLWVYDNDNGRSSAYRSLHINSEARVSSFRDLPFPPDEPFYPDHARMKRYFEEYAARFDLLRRIRFNSPVVNVEERAGGLAVRVENGAEEVFDGVVAASGHQSDPRDPPEVKDYTGQYLHAHDYRVPEPFAGKRVLVIGPGNSGVDVAADICSLTEHTVLCARSPVLIMPRMMFGKPQSRTLGLLEKPWVPWAVRIRVRALLTRIFHGNMEEWGFRTPKTRTHPISHPTLISQMAWGRITAKPGIRSVQGREVTFVDGTSDTFDAIIAATGYVTTFPYLAKEKWPLQGTRPVLYNRVAHPTMPGLYFVGLFDVSGGSNIRMMDDQSEYVAAIAAGRVRLPDAEDMRQAIAADHAFSEKEFPGSPRYGLELDPWRYRKLLAREYARNRVTPPPAQRPDLGKAEVA